MDTSEIIFGVRADSLSDVVADGSYNGHRLMSNLFRTRRKDFDNFFNRILSGEDEDMSDAVRRIFFETFDRNYYLEQQKLAIINLHGKIVQVKHSRCISSVDIKINPNNFPVLFVSGRQSGSNESDILFSLALSPGHVCRIEITSDSIIKILGDIP